MLTVALVAGGAKCTRWPGCRALKDTYVSLGHRQERAEPDRHLAVPRPELSDLLMGAVYSIRPIAQVCRPDGDRMSGSDLFKTYEAWARRRGLEPMTATAFGHQVKTQQGARGRS